MAAPTIQSHNNHTSVGGTTATIAVTATGSGDVIVVAATIGTLSGTVIPTLSIAGGGANVGSWTKIGSMPVSVSTEYAIEAWYAVTTGAVSAQTVTITSSITIDGAAVAYVTVAGAATSAPLDLNSTLCTGTNGSATKFNQTGQANLSISTNTNNVLAFAILGNIATPTTFSNPTTGTTITEGVNNAAGSNWAELGVYTAPATTGLSSFSIGMTNSFPAGGAMFAFAITADSTANTGTFAFTEPADTFAFAGSDANTGTLAITEAPDTFVFAGSDAITGTLVVTEAPDTFAFSGSAANSGTLAVTEAADTFLFAGADTITGTLSVTEAADTFAFSGAIVEGVLAITEAADTFLFTGTVAPPPPQPGPQIAFPLRERTYRRRFVGLGYDPKFVISKDRPGPIRIIEFIGEMKDD